MSDIIKKGDLWKNELLQDALSSVKNFSVLKKEDILFLLDKQAHLNQVFEAVHMWRTDIQKESIVSDLYCPTPHSKFHQAINEQKVQLDQAFYLAKDYEMKKLDIEELEDTMSELEGSPERTKKIDIDIRRKRLELQFKKYELKQMELAMHYRMDEVRGWQKIEERLIDQMKNEGMDEDSIWNKTAGEIESNFFMFLNNLQGIRSTTDGAERNNLIALALFGVKCAKETGMFEKLLSRCTPLQMNSLEMLGEVKRVEPKGKQEEK